MQCILPLRRPDGSIRKHNYVGAYKGTGTNGTISASGVNNAVNFKRSAARTAMAGRGTGWHQYSYWQYNAIQHLYLAEYQDMNSQRVLGDGSMAGGTYVVNTGLSNARGNRCGHVTHMALLLITCHIAALKTSTAGHGILLMESTLTKGWFIFAMTLPSLQMILQQITHRWQWFHLPVALTSVM